MLLFFFPVGAVNEILTGLWITLNNELRFHYFCPRTNTGLYFLWISLVAGTFNVFLNGDSASVMHSCT